MSKVKPQTTRFPGLRTAAEFYGISHAQFTRLKKMGDDARDKMPVDHPEEMPGWFERMRSKEIYGRKCPQSVLDAAAAEKKRTVATRPVKTPAIQPLAPVEQMLPLRTISPSEASTDDIIAHQRRLWQRLADRYERLIESGLDDEPEGLSIYRRMQELEKSILAYGKGAEKLRDENNWMHITAVKMGVAEMGRKYHALVKKEMLAQFPPADDARVKAAMDEVGVRLSSLIPAAMADETPAGAAA